MKNRKKSMSEIYRQASRIARDLYGSKVHPKGWSMVMRIQEIYLTNAAQHFGFAAWQDFCSQAYDSRRDEKIMKKIHDVYNAKVGREVYAHPFDWDKVRNVSSIKEAVSISWSLHWMGYSVQPESWTFEEIKADLIALADAYGCTS